ncbi:hypothetical protein BDY19DRAFT_887714 [Irpex rosettiformis]|uniref:Uncharacterized protein n=1 Tax=Irpex rosettiformis TaxID=378272 RepID=A0ACB8U8M4_9APHY|nr:hypothetical protein BDY19DRAFT_887714 [Irpex rosettiformis]
MSSARYAPLPNPYNNPDADREMNEAFQLEDDDDDNDDHTESTPLTRHHEQQQQQHPERPPQLSVATSPGAYDFEREYDYDFPPPGSPPDPSIARPNDIGNTNGVLPGTPVRPEPHTSRPSIFRRLVGALLPQHYQRVPSEPGAQHLVGGGEQNDGVFANVAAKPARQVEVRGENGDIYMVPEETQANAPPSYSEAQADAVPPYWETTIHAPGSLDPNADMVVDDLPTGSWLLFFANVFISWFFQFIGFLFAYLLHTTHAAKYGARVGLGLTLIQFGFYSRKQMIEDVIETPPGVPSSNETMPMMSGMPGMGSPVDGNGTGSGTGVDVNPEEVGSRDWIAFLLMTLGWFLLLSSLAGFYRVKRWERSIRRASQPAAERDTESRRTMESTNHIFPLFMGLDMTQDHTNRAEGQGTLSEAEMRLTRDLRAAGLI